MASESFNGSDPARPASQNGAEPKDDEGDGGTEFERFERLARKVVTTPKDELDDKLEQAKRQKAAR